MAVKVVVNKDSGNCKRLDVATLINNLHLDDYTVQYVDRYTDWNANDCNTVVVCGGDGTLSNAINRCIGKRIIYAPCGTLNECRNLGNTVNTVGKVNDKLFGYVCATGSFCPIGYSATPCEKQKIKSWAYVKQILRCYHSYQISADITLNDTTYSDCYTLVMIIKNSRCFRFNFNRCYNINPKTYLLAVKSMGKDNLINRIKMFFPFFRIFMIGLNKPTVNKRFIFEPFDKLTVKLNGPQDFCIDGEKHTLNGTLEFCEQQLEYPVTVVQTPLIKKRRVQS